MSYLHCPHCNRAYNLARTATCPRCAATRDTSSEVGEAAERLAAALARATPAEIAAARTRGSADAAALLRTLAANQPADAVPPHHQALLASVALALVARVSALGAARPVRPAYAMFLFAKAQLTRFHHASMNFGRALR